MTLGGRTGFAVGVVAIVPHGYDYIYRGVARGHRPDRVFECPNGYRVADHTVALNNTETTG